MNKILSKHTLVYPGVADLIRVLNNIREIYGNLEIFFDNCNDNYICEIFVMEDMRDGEQFVIIK